MADQDDLFYLQPGFDLSSLRVPQLRSILVSQDVPYPSSAKKQDLVDIIQQNIIPRSKKLLSAQARVRRTSRGITDVPSSQEGSIDDDGDKEKMPPPPTRTPRGRKSRTNLVSEDEMTSTPKTSRKSKTPNGRRSTKARMSDTEPDTDKSHRSVRNTRESMPISSSIAQPTVTLDEPAVSYSKRSLTSGTSPFSDDNPFQSGSSPPSASRVSSASRTRKSTGRKSTGRRETTSPVIKQEDTEYTSSTYNLPVSKLGADRNGVEFTEEFTPDADNELKQELASNKQLARSRNSALTRHQRKPVSTVAKTAPLAVLTTILAAIGGWYRQEKISIGYCGIGQAEWSLASNPNIPAWIHENLQPQCEPCPPHAICFPKMEVRCEDDFVLQPHPLTLNGLVPLAPSCEPDSEKERRVKAVADKAIEELRERRAVYECGDEVIITDAAIGTTTTSQVVTTTVSKLEISEEMLKKEVSKMRRKGMSSEEFEDLWKGALGDIIGREEVEVLRDGSGKILLSSKSLARLPFACAIRRSFVKAVSRNRIPIAVLVFLVGCMVYGRQRVITYNQAKTQTPSLVAMTLDRLATQAALKEDGRSSEGFISIAQLRDDVLRNVFSVRERERVWQRVRKIVEGNSNVRAATREGGKTGEWSRVWEWIGPVDLAPGLEGRRSGLIQGPDTPEREEREIDRSASTRRWDEGRPIY